MNTVRVSDRGARYADQSLELQAVVALPVASSSSRQARASRSGARISALADQDGVDADPLELVELLAGADAGLGDDGLAGRDVGEQLERALDVDREVGEVAVVDADHVGVDARAPRSSSSSSWTSTSTSRSSSRASRVQRARASLALERGDDQQDRVGAGDRRLVELVAVDDEVLAQDRQVASPRAPRAGRRASRRSGRSR